MVLLVLALIWAVVLIPPALRNRAEGRPSDSIVAFRRQLAVLNRAGPRVPGADPAASPRMRSGTGSRAAAVPQGPATMAAMAARSGGASRASLARRRTARRRRDVLVALLAAAVGTLVLGAVPALRFLWVAHVVVDVLLVAYVALLIRQRNLVAERAQKVRFLPGPRPVDSRAWSQTDSAWLAN